jgi:hypothetical protein
MFSWAFKWSSNDHCPNKFKCQNTFTLHLKMSMVRFDSVRHIVCPPGKSIGVLTLTDIHTHSLTPLLQSKKMTAHLWNFRNIGQYYRNLYQIRSDTTCVTLQQQLQFVV